MLDVETFNRRYVLRTSLASFACLCGVVPKLVGRSQAANRTLEWNAFTDLLEAAAREFDLKRTTSELHVRKVARLLDRLNLTTLGLGNTPVAKMDRKYPYPEFKDLMRTIEVQVSLLSFSVGEHIHITTIHP